MIRAELIDLNEVIGGIDELLRSTAGGGTEFRLSCPPGSGPSPPTPARSSRCS